MTSSYRMRLKENQELRMKNKELQDKIKELMRAVDILNNCINSMNHISKSINSDLVEEFEKLCDEIEEDKKNDKK